jgi:hypothetical protein
MTAAQFVIVFKLVAPRRDQGVGVMEHPTGFMAAGVGPPLVNFLKERVASSAI